MITTQQFEELRMWACAKSSRTVKITIEHDFNGEHRTEIWAYDSDFGVGQYVTDASQIDLPQKLKRQLETETSRLRSLMETQQTQ